MSSTHQFPPGERKRCAECIIGASPGGANFHNCTNCIDPFTGFYRGANGQVLTLQQLQKGRINPKSILNTGAGLFGSIGDPTFADIARQIQLSLHVRF